MPDSGGTPATVIVTIDLDDLLAKTGYVITSDGTLIKTDTALAAADQADIYWAFMERTGQVVAPRPHPPDRLPAANHRLLRPGPRLLLPRLRHPTRMVRTAPHPALGRRRATDLNNLTLVCSYHHHNFLTKGWECRTNPQGLPEWLPPWWIDRTRNPMINNKIRASLAATEHRRR